MLLKLNWTTQRTYKDGSSDAIRGNMVDCIHGAEKTLYRANAGVGR